MSSEPEKRIQTLGLSRDGQAAEGLDAGSTDLELCNAALKFITDDQLYLLIRGSQFMLGTDGSARALGIATQISDLMDDAKLRNLSQTMKLVVAINSFASALDRQFPVATHGLPSRMQTLAHIQANPRMIRD